MGPLTITLLIVVALLVVFFWFAGRYADVLWYDQLGYLQVLFTEWGAGAIMFAIGLVAMAVPLYVNLQIAYRARPVYAKLNEQLDRYQQVIEPIRRGAMVFVPAIFGLFAGVALIASWQTVLMWMNATPFGETDPVFNLDVSFYIFQLPFYRGVVAFVSAVVLLSLILTAATLYLYGGIRVTGREVVISKSARTHIAILAGLYMLVQAVSFWLDRYAALNTLSGRWTGVLYTEANATIPGQGILAGAAIVVAVLFFIAAAIGRWRLPLVGTALLVIVGLVVGMVYPWIVQQFQVGPSEQALETPYIQNNIDATRTAYGLDQIEEVNYAAETTVSQGQLRNDADTTANIRILDPSLVSPTFAQFEQERAYYQFPDRLDVDRYEIDGQVQDAVGSVRDINIAGLGADAQSWVNNTIVYTHGYGLVTAYGNQRGPDGQPLFIEGGMPSEGALGEFEPRVYFGESSPEYSIVGAPEGSEPAEFDHVSGADGATQTYNTFTGEGGPDLGNLFNRLVYAIKFQSEQILLSEYVNDESQILYDRDPAERVQAAAPYLTIDSDPYPSVVDGRLTWIVDGYTTSNKYPYSELAGLQNLLEDADTPATSLPPEVINYMRNSVKATVDAYDGSVTLYAFDETDPILQTWQKVFPSTLKNVSEMSGDLLSHIRYPTDMFKVQREMFARYHVTDASTFYNQTNAWQLPQNPTGGEASQPPYYLTMQMPGQESAFSIYSTYIPLTNANAQSRNVLRGYLAANSDAGKTDGTVADTYGRITLLRVENDNVNGPGQVQNIFNSNETVANQLNLLERGGQTAVLRGNLLTVPVGEGFLYVQPVYVESTGETSYPLLRRVLVAFGDKIAFQPTLDEALDELFGGDAGADAGDGGVEVSEDDVPVDSVPDGTTSTPAPTATTPPAGGGTGTPQEQLSTALADAQQALEDRTAAYASNDLVAAAEADKRLTDALNRARDADSQVSGTSTAPSDSPEPTPTT